MFDELTTVEWIEEFNDPKNTAKREYYEAEADVALRNGAVEEAQDTFSRDMSACGYWSMSRFCNVLRTAVAQGTMQRQGACTILTMIRWRAEDHLREGGLPFDEEIFFRVDAKALDRSPERKR